MRQRLLWELRLAFTALQFFTRVPVPAWVGWSPAQSQACVRWFPAVGCAVGAVAAGVYGLAGLWWPPAVAVLLSMVASVWLTGALHEDGLADCCDAFGGGGDDRARILAILKDSRVGAYAVVGLVLVLGLKYQLLQALPPQQFLWVSMGSHALSRWSALWVMARLPYAREDGASKSRDLARGVPAGAVCWGLMWGLVPWCALAVQHHAVVALAACITAWAVAGLAVRALRTRLGGYVGDALGATQQVAELAILLSWLACIPTLSKA